MPRAAETVLDELLVLQAQAGRPEAWRALVDAWNPLLIGRAMRLLGDRARAADAVQETWLSVARGIVRLEDPARFAPWLYRVLARRCADQARLDRRRVERAGDVAGVAGPGPAGSGGSGALRAAIDRLPVEQRLLLSMRYADGVPLRVIGEILGIPEGTVKSRLHVAREALRVLLERGDADPGGGPEGG